MQTESPESIRIFDIAIGCFVSVIGWLGANTLTRVRKLEQDRQTVTQAGVERAELKDDIKRLSDRMDTQHERIFSRLDDIVDRLPPRVQR